MNSFTRSILRLSARRSVRRGRHRVLAALLVVAIVAPPVAAQPGPEKADPTKTAPGAGPQDEPTYKCGKPPKEVSWNFKPETELKDLLTWAMGFTCRNYLLDPRIVSTGKKVTIMA